MTRRLTLALFAFLIFPLPGKTATLHVSKTGDASDGLSWPTAYTAIGDALAVSASGDEIWVASGTYNESIQMKQGVDLYGGFLEISGENQWESRDWILNETTIDGADLHRRIVSASDDAVIDGFTIRNARAPESGAGMSCISSTLVVANCLFQANVSNATRIVPYCGSGGCSTTIEYIGNGGGVITYDSVVTFLNCSFHGNKSNARGGALSITQQSEVAFLGCDFAMNESNRSGGGIYVSQSMIDLEGCQFSNNLGYEGGAVRLDSDSTANLHNSDFEGNRTTGGGGILHASLSSLSADKCNILDNTGTRDSTRKENGTIYLDYSVATIHSCRIRGNTVRAGGGGIYASRSDLNLVNSNVSDNHSIEDAGGVNLYRSSFLISNSIISDNTVEVEGSETTGGGMLADVFYSPLHYKVVNSIVWGNSPPDVEFLGERQNTICFSNVGGNIDGPGNISTDPLFVDPENGDFRLQYGSPCIDSGTFTESLTDLDGNARPIDIPGLGVDGPGAFDMGAYEYQFPAGDLNANGYSDPMDLFIFGGDWMRASGGSRR